MPEKIITIALYYKVFVGLILTLLLFSLVSFPLGHDQALFETGGAMIARQGAVPFRDFLDMKQPLIFYIYGISTILFGRHEWSSRLLDVCYHLVSLSLLYILIRRTYKNEKIALVSVCCYILYIVGAGFWMTTTTETFALLPQIGIVYAMLILYENQNKKHLIQAAIISALCTILLVLLKVTFGIVVLEILTWLVLTIDGKRKQYLSFFVFYSLSLILFGAITLYWLSSSHALGNIMLSLSWVNKYASAIPLLGVETFRSYYYKVFPEELLVTITPTYLILTIYSFFVLYPNKSEQKSSLSQFKLFCILAIAFGLFGVALERKSFNYHYTRVLWAVVPFVAEGLINIITNLKKWSTNVLKREKHSLFLIRLPIIVIALVIMLIYSPLPRVIDQGFGWGMIAIQNDESGRLAKLRSNKYDIEEIQSIAKYLKVDLGASDHIFLWGNMSQLYFESNTLPTTICIVNPQFISPWTPQQWIDTLSAQLSNALPKYFISEYNDSRPLISGTKEDSFQSLVRIPQLHSILLQSYRLEDSTTHFKIFKRINS